MLLVGALAIPNQQLSCQLNSQAVGVNIYQYAYGLFMDVYVAGTAIITGVICENLNLIVRDAYLGFQGDFVWFDGVGASDPVYTGIGTRFKLVYLSPTDLATLGLAG
jgi:hypothetical protein